MKWEQLEQQVDKKINKKPGCNKAKQTLINAET